jgi:hypothetical protein
MRRGLALGLFLIATACANPEHTPPKTVAAVVPAGEVEAPLHPVETVAESMPASPEPEPPASALPRVCNPVTLTETLSPYLRDLEMPALGPPTLLDLEAAPPPPGKFGDAGWSGFFGPRDFDGDGRGDRVLAYTSVDYWLWLLFVERPGCIELVGSVPGYQVQAGSARHNGLSDIDALSYPVMGHIERYRYDGKGYVQRP